VQTFLAVQLIPSLKSFQVMSSASVSYLEKSYFIMSKQNFFCRQDAVSVIQLSNRRHQSNKEGIIGQQWH